MVAAAFFEFLEFAFELVPDPQLEKVLKLVLVWKIVLFSINNAYISYYTPHKYTGPVNISQLPYPASDQYNIMFYILKYFIKKRKRRSQG